MNSSCSKSIFKVNYGWICIFIQDVAVIYTIDAAEPARRNRPFVENCNARIRTKLVRYSKCGGRRHEINAGTVFAMRRQALAIGVEPFLLRLSNVHMVRIDFKEIGRKPRLRTHLDRGGFRLRGGSARFRILGFVDRGEGRGGDVAGRMADCARVVAARAGMGALLLSQSRVQDAENFIGGVRLRGRMGGLAPAATAVDNGA